MSGLVRERFLWVEKLNKGLTFLLEDTIDPYFKVKQGSDPLTAYLTINFRRRLPKASRGPIREYIRFWAGTADCEIPRIDIEPSHLVATILFKYRRPKGQPIEGKD